jgi:antitoxin (DNA-binding transcriptional repressor) of toxin-antitoxin stability system
MRQATNAELQTRLSELIDLAAAGEEVRITRQGRPFLRFCAETLVYGEPPRAVLQQTAL